MNSWTCAELKRMGLEAHVTIPGSCVIGRRVEMEADLKAAMGRVGK